MNGPYKMTEWMQGHCFKVAKMILTMIKSREILTYDSDDVDYKKGTVHKLSDSHSVLATSEELSLWLD